MINRRILAVDVGTRKTKALSASISDSNIIIDSSAELCTEGFSRGILVDEKLLASVVQKVIECADYVTGSVSSEIHLGIGGMEIRTFHCMGSIALNRKNYIQQSDIERVCKAALLAGVADEFRVIHSFPIAFWVDKEPCTQAPLHTRGSHLEVQVHVVAIFSKQYDSIMEALSELGINVADLSANVIVGAESLIQQLECANALFLDIGDGTIDVAILREGMIVWSKSISFGGGYIVRDIMTSLELEQSQAEAVLRYYAKLDKMDENVEVLLGEGEESERTVKYGFLRTVIESRVCEIVEMIGAHVEATVIPKPLQSIYLTGGCAELPSFSQCLQQHFHTPVEIVYPDVAVEYANVANNACYAIIQHALKNSIVLNETITDPVWGNIKKKCKNFFKMHFASE